MGDANNGAATPAATPGQAEAAAIADKGAAAIPGAPGSTPAAPNSTGNPIKDAAAAAARKIKIDNDEVDENEVIKVYRDRKGHQRAANKELQEGRAARKQSEEFITAMRDPTKLVDTLQKLGWDSKQIRQVAEQYLSGVLEDEMMDPKDKELKTTKQKLEEFERQDKARKDDEENTRNEVLKKKYADEYSREFIEALKTTGIPPTKEHVGEMAKYISRAAKIKMPMTAVEAAKLVQQDIENRSSHLFKNMTPEQIIKIVGEDGLKKLREFDTSRLKDPNANLQTPADQGEVNRKRDTAAKRMTPAEWRAYNRK